jgi:uncharacterized protein
MAKDSAQPERPGVFHRRRAPPLRRPQDGRKRRPALAAASRKVMIAAITEAEIAELPIWLAKAGLEGRRETALVESFCSFAAAAGLPLKRAVAFIATFHPIHEGRAFRWERDTRAFPIRSRAVCVIKRSMNRQEILDRLRQNERALRERGVTHAALFGSRARGDNRPNSDTDIMIDIDPEMEMSVYDYVGLKRYIASLFDGRVDVVNRDALKPSVGPVATADAVYAF